MFQSNLSVDTTPLLMVVGGANADGFLDDVELISPKPNEECSNAVSPLSGILQFFSVLLQKFF
jgi:hypothetical protein